VDGPSLFMGLAPPSFLPCRRRFCPGDVFIGNSGCGAGFFLLCCVSSLGLGFPFALDWLTRFFGMSIGAEVLCSVFLYINMYACHGVWCMCFVVVWVVMASLYNVHLSSLFVIAV